MSKIFYELADLLGRALVDGIKLLFTSRIAALATAVVLAAAAFLIGAWSFERADRYQRLVEAALGKTTENTPQSMKALESLVLAYLETDAEGKELTFKTDVEGAPLSSDLKDTLTSLDAVLSQKELAPPPAALTLVKKDVLVRDAVVTEDLAPDGRGFLFLPMRLLYIENQPVSSMSSAQLEQLLHLNVTRAPGAEKAELYGCAASSLRPLCDDVLITRALVKPLVESMLSARRVTKKETGLDDVPVQAYVITENGINRILNRAGHDRSRYSKQFNANMTFPSRPYYVAALKHANQRHTPGPRPLREGLKDDMPLGDYFYVSEPYLDIGGNGIVVTLARAFRYPGHSDGVIAFDLTVANYDVILRRLESMVTALGGAAAVATCPTKDEGQTACTQTRGDANLYQHASKKLNDKLDEVRKNDSTSDVAGNIVLLAIDSSSGGTGNTTNASVGDAVLNSILDKIGLLIAHQSREILFTVPVEQQKADGSGTGQLTLLVASLNIGRYLQNSAVAAALSLFLLGIAITTFVGSLVAESRLKDAKAEEAKRLDDAAKHEQKQLEDAAKKERDDLRTALENVAIVMQSVNVPYVRLDNDDYVIDGNFALARFLGLPATKDSVNTRLIHTKFEHWLADEVSKTEYRRIQKRRREGQVVDPYELTFRPVSGNPRTARVVSGVVPATQTSSGSLPETFGILD